MTTLREAAQQALAEDAMQRLTDEQQEMEATINKMETVEPVAYVNEDGWFRHAKDADVAFKAIAIPLYVNPPPRKRTPLTKESLLYIYNQLPNWGMDMDRLPQGLEKFARAIERAHGIKEEK